MKAPIQLSPMLDRGGQPSVRELLSALDFNPIKGTISLGDARIVMQRASVGDLNRRQLIESLGEAEAQVFLLRQGFLSGLSDAKFVRRTWPNLNQGDAFTAGTRLHMFSGVVRVETVHNDFDFRRKRFAGEFIWHDSVEAELIRHSGLRSSGPACWTQVGYAAGYASQFFDTPIIYKEVSCIAQGDKHCRVIGKPLDEWDQDDPFIRIFRTRVIDCGHPPRPARPSRPPVDDPVLGQDSAPLDHLGHHRIPVLICGGCATTRRHAVRRIMGDGGDIAAPADLSGLIDAQLKQSARKKLPDWILVDDVTRLDRAAQAALARGIDRGAAIVATSGLTRIELAQSDQMSDALWSALAPGLVELTPLSQRGRAGLDAIVNWAEARATERTGLPGLSAEGRDWLAEHADRMSLSMLEAVVARAVVNGTGTAAGPEALAAALSVVDRSAGHAGDKPALASLVNAALHQGELPFDALEAMVYDTAVSLNQGNLAAAARQLGLSRAQLAYRLERLASGDRPSTIASDSSG